MIPYEFSVLRYSFDPLTQEFINVGVVLHSATARFLQARVNTNYGRATKVFGRIDGSRYRFLLRHIQDKLDEMGLELMQGQLFDLPASLEASLSRVLPIDDSSLRFDRGGAGISDDLTKTCEKIYRRYVIGNEFGAVECRTREDVWRTFRKPLDRLEIASRLVPKLIAAKDYKYEFQHAWKNGVWNLYEPISFDLLDESAIREKANKWLGRSLCLNESSDAFKLTFLLGAPQSSRLRDAFQHAENILNKIPAKKEIVREEEAESFAQKLESQLKNSNPEQVA
jgi:Protein of unknown function (DUF3037)